MKLSQSGITQKRQSVQRINHSNFKFKCNFNRLWDTPANDKPENDMKTDPEPAEHPNTTVFDLLGDKWTLVILRDLLFEGKTTFTEFKASPEKIASNILTSRLKSLDSEGFVIKTGSASNKVKYWYSLTDKAIDLLPVFIALFQWSEKHVPSPVSISTNYQKLSKPGADIAAYARELRKKRDADLGMKIK
jgi:DNA-binding HxlR family transcriptional regulator